MEIGEKIKRLRIQMGLTQEELANRCELTKGFISQVERNLTSPSIATLVDILESLGTDLNNFFSETVKEKIVFTRDDVFIQECEDGKVTINWIIPNAQKNRMEPILLKLSPGGGSAVYRPHEGEVFGYVLSGTVYLHLGKLSYKAKKGESFYYKADREYYLENKSLSDAVVIWVTTPPNF